MDHQHQEVEDEVGNLQNVEVETMPLPKPTRGGVKGKRGRRRKSNILRITRKRRPKKKYQPQPEVQEVQEPGEGTWVVSVCASDDLNISKTSSYPNEPSLQAPDFTNLMILADAAAMRLAEIEALKQSKVQQNSETSLQVSTLLDSCQPPKKRRRGRKSKDEVLRIDVPAYYD